MCFRSITVGLSPPGGCHLPRPPPSDLRDSRCCKVRQIYNYREAKSSAVTVVVKISGNVPRELPWSLSLAWTASVRERKEKRKRT